jgi:hypothetical protein
VCVCVCGHNILTESVFVTQLSCNAEISVWQIVWVTANCCFINDNISIPMWEISLELNTCDFAKIYIWTLVSATLKAPQNAGCLY